MNRERVFHRIGRAGSAGADKLRTFAKSRVFERILHFAMGFALSLAALKPEMMPFGLAFAAACKAEVLFASLGAFLGYAMTYQAGGLIYAAAVMVCFGCRVVFKNTRAARSAYMMPLCAMACLLLTKSVLAISQGVKGVALLLCEGVLCAGFGLLYQVLQHREKYHGKTILLWARVAVTAAALLIIAPFRVLGDISLARCIAGFVVMTVSCFGGSALGAGVGAALGACMDLTAGGGPFFAAVYGFAGLSGGLGGRKGRFWCAVCHVLANSVATLWGYTNPGAMPGLFECFIASVIFVLLPDSWLERLSFELRTTPATPHTAPRPTGHRAFAQGKLQSISNAIGELGVALEGFWGQSKGENPEDISKIFDRAADRVCRKCPTASVCWEREYMDTHQVLGDVTALLRRKNFLQPQDFASHFASRCASLRQLTGAINEEYRSHLRRAASLRRDTEARALMSRQYSSLQGVLTDMAGSVSTYPEYYPALESRVKGIVRAYCPGARVTVYSQTGRMHVEIGVGQEADALSDQQALLQSLSLALKKTFWPPKVIPAKNGSILRFSEKESFAVTVKSAVRKKPGEAVCGDTSMNLHTDDGRAIVLLSDGMGTGQAASVMSQKALELISGFVKSGCSLVESTKAVLPVLTARFDEWGFVTLDLLEINLFTGEGQMLKLGAAPSFLIRDGRTARLQADSLPAGLEPMAGESELRPVTLRLQQGDRLVLMSDGVWESANVKRVIQEHLDTDDLGAKLVSAAVEDGGADDMSVIVVNLLQDGE